MIFICRDSVTFQPLSMRSLKQWCDTQETRVRFDKEVAPNGKGMFQLSIVVGVNASDVSSQDLLTRGMEEIKSLRRYYMEESMQSLRSVLRMPAVPPSEVKSMENKSAPVEPQTLSTIGIITYYSNCMVLCLRYFIHSCRR